MGLYLSKLVDVFSQFGSGEPARILMLGLDAAGKLKCNYWDWFKKKWNNLLNGNYMGMTVLNACSLGVIMISHVYVVVGNLSVPLWCIHLSRLMPPPGHPNELNTS